MGYDLNEVNLIGRITSDIEVKQTPNRSIVTNFSLATNKSYTNKDTGITTDTATFHNLVIWGKGGEIISQYSGKGQKIFIKGELQTRSWEAQDGTKRYKTEISVKDFILLGNKKEQDEFNDDQYFSNESELIQKKSSPRKDEEINIEDIPFK